MVEPVSTSFGGDDTFDDDELLGEDGLGEDGLGLLESDRGFARCRHATCAFRAATSVSLRMEISNKSLYLHGRLAFEHRRHVGFVSSHCGENCQQRQLGRAARFEKFAP